MSLMLPIIICVLLLIGALALVISVFCFKRRKQRRRRKGTSNTKISFQFHEVKERRTKPSLIRQHAHTRIGDTSPPKFESRLTSLTTSPPVSPMYSPLQQEDPSSSDYCLLHLPLVEASFRRTSVQAPIREDSLSSDHSLCSSFHSLEPPSTRKLKATRDDDLGSIYFNLSYNKIECVLRLVIQKAVNLPVKDLSGSSDPFVRILLLPDRKNTLETRIKYKSLNPTWNESFTFEGFPQALLRNRTLYLQVIDYDKFSRNDPIGEAELHLATVNLQQEPVPYVEKLSPCKRTLIYLGSFLIALSYDPGTYSDPKTNAQCNRITVSVMKCTNLKLKKRSDVYVKVYHMHRGKRLGKMKTKVRRNTLSSIWNESFEFDVDVNHIREISFVLVLTSFDSIFPNETVGQVVLGQQISGTPQKHWADMLNNPKKSISMWHKIIS